MTRKLGLQEILGNSFSYEMSNIYTSMPAVVVGVDNSSMRVDVQPAVNMRNEDGTEDIPRPNILNVPLQIPISDLGGVSFPISAGCPVLLVWSMRGLDKWKRGNGLPESPTDLRRFDIRDCIALPSVYPQGMSKNSPQSRTNDHSPNDVVLVHNLGSGSEVEVRLKPDGNVEINSPNKVIVNCTDAEVNASSSMNIETSDMTINSSSFTVNTGTYAISATGTATQTGTFSHNGQMNVTGDINLNGKSVDEHSHGGVQSGGSNTQPFNA